jgi:hypothetical protein
VDVSILNRERVEPKQRARVDVAIAILDYIAEANLLARQTRTAKTFQSPYDRRPGHS